jgi:hypothetical protein
MVTIPAVKPVIIPEEDPIVAVTVLLDSQVPPPIVPERVVGVPIQILEDADIGPGDGPTVTTYGVELALPHG